MSKNTPAATAKKEINKFKKELFTLLEQYQKQLSADDSISDTKFKHMNVAIYGCKLLIKEVK